jgi:DNA transposition AAA+ family ATPase
MTATATNFETTTDFALVNINDLALKVAQTMSTMPHSKVESLLMVNRRYLYDIKAGRTNTVPASEWRKIQEFYATYTEGPVVTKDWHIAETANFSVAVGVFQKAQSQKLCLALTGTTGFGKTESAKIYRQKTGGVVYVHCNTEMTKTQFLDAILLDLGIAPQHRGGNTQEKITTIVRAIVKLENPLLIIDDAGKLRDSAFRMFQILFDEAAGRVGFMLLGVPEFKDKVFHHANKGTFCYREIARRIGWASMGDIRKSDVKNICQKNGITDESAISYLCDNAGDFDTLKRLVKAAKTAANTEGVEINRAFFSDTVGSAFENYRVSFIK